MNKAYRLNASASEKISCKLPSKCPTRNRQRNKPVKAIQYFLAREDFKSADFAIIFV
jgi:hypothetical protein